MCVCVFVEPVVPKITAVSISELQYNKFTLNLQSDIFNDSNGPVLFYGVLVYTDTLGMSNNLRLLCSLNSSICICSILICKTVLL